MAEVLIIQNKESAEGQAKSIENIESQLKKLEETVEELKTYTLPKVEQLEPTPPEIEIANSLDSFQEWLNAMVVQDLK